MCGFGDYLSAMLDVSGVELFAVDMVGPSPAASAA